MDIEKAALKALKPYADPERAQHSQRYFRTGAGEYGAGDRFLGVRVPDTRRVALQFKSLSPADYKMLVASPWHEVRFLALVVLVEQFRGATPEIQEKIYRTYMRHRKGINNWDLVDTSAPVIVGGYYQNRSRAGLHKLSRASDIWDRRIAVLACFRFIRENDFKDVLEIAERMLSDQRDLIQKATGWMLREVANRDRVVVEMFLRQHCHEMPRTMLRYAIEKFPESRRKAWLRDCKSTGMN